MEDDSEPPDSKLLLQRAPLQNRLLPIGLKKPLKLKIKRSELCEKTADFEIVEQLKEPETKLTIFERAVGNFNAERDEISAQNIYNKSVDDGHPFKCAICQSYFMIGSKLELHYIINHEIYNCEICSCLFDSRELKDEHVRKFHTNFTCEICQGDLINGDKLLEHYETEHNCVACMFCFFILSPKEMYREHLLKKHLITEKYLDDLGIIATRIESELEFFCTLCDKNREVEVFHGHMHSYHKIKNTLLMNLINKYQIKFKINGANFDNEPATKTKVLPEDCCSICESTYTKRIPEKFHLIYCKSKLLCRYCEKYFDTIEKREVHTQKAHNKFVCTLGCDKFTETTELRLSDHYLKYHDIITCRYCDIFISPSNNHLQEQHKYKAVKMQHFPDSLYEIIEVKNKHIVLCCLCDENITLLTDNVRDIYAHYKQIHSITLKKILNLLTSKPVLEDDYTEFYREINESIIKTELETDTTSVLEIKLELQDDEQIYLNEDFRQDFDPQKIELLLDYYQPPEATQYKCEYCGLIIDNLADIIKHLKDIHRVRLNVKEQKCEHCKLIFYHDQLYLEHYLNTHSSTLLNLYKCGCDSPVFTSLAYSHILNQHSDELEKHEVKIIGINCRFCDESFWLRTNLNRHEVERHYLENRREFLKCSECLNIFSNQQCLKEHTKSQHPESPIYSDIIYKCIECTLVYPNIAQIRQHFDQEHPDLKVFICPASNCYKTSPRIKFLRNHLRQPHPEKLKTIKPEPCDLCGKISKSHRSASIHKLMKHGRDKSGFQCRICRERFTTCEKRKLHYTTVHPGQLAYRCLVCGKGFLSKSGLYGHKKIHEDNYDNNKTCPYCGKEFTRRDSYNEHLLIHIGPRHQCPHCPKTFTQRSNLTRHVRIHTGQKPYQCSYCEKKFSDQGACRSHERVHTKEEHCECSYCGKKFTKWQKLKYHVKFHTGEGLIDCDVCGKKFSNTYSLGEHRKIHNQETLIMCNTCGKGFTKEKYLQRHIQNVHSEPTPSKYVCPICFKTMLHKSSYKNHIMTHSSIKHLRCKVCNKKYQTRRTIRKHVADVHNINPTEDLNAYIHELTPEEVGLIVPDASEMYLDVNQLFNNAPNTTERTNTVKKLLNENSTNLTEDPATEDEDIPLATRTKRKIKKPRKYMMKKKVTKKDKIRGDDLELSD